MKAGELSTSSNQLLAGLSAEDQSLVAPFLNRVDLPVRTMLERHHQVYDSVYFLEAGLASVVAATSLDRRLEVGIIGAEGMTGLSVVLCGGRSANDCYMQISGEGLKMSCSALVQTMDVSETLRKRLLCYVQAFLTQMAQTALANGRAQIEERLARWLVMAHDRVEGDELAITHEFLALMLGTRRASVTSALHNLEGEGLVKATRGVIIIRDRPALETYADGLYGIAEVEYNRLLASFPRTPQPRDILAAG